MDRIHIVLRDAREGSPVEGATTSLGREATFVFLLRTGHASADIKEQIPRSNEISGISSSRSVKCHFFK